MNTFNRLFLLLLCNLLGACLGSSQFLVRHILCHLLNKIWQFPAQAQKYFQRMVCIKSASVSSKKAFTYSFMVAIFIRSGFLSTFQKQFMLASWSTSLFSDQDTEALWSPNFIPPHSSLSHFPLHVSIFFFVYIPSFSVAAHLTVFQDCIVICGLAFPLLLYATSSSILCRLNTSIFGFSNFFYLHRRTGHMIYWVIGCQAEWIRATIPVLRLVFT